MSNESRLKHSPINSPSIYFLAMLLLFALYGLSTPKTIASSDRCWTAQPEYVIDDHIVLFVDVAIDHYRIVITGPDNRNATNSPLEVSIERTGATSLDLTKAAPPLGEWTVRLWHVIPNEKSAENWPADVSKGPAAVCHYTVVERLDRCRVESELSDNPTFYVGQNLTLDLNVAVPRNDTPGQYIVIVYVPGQPNVTIQLGQLSPGSYHITATAGPPPGQRRIELWWTGTTYNGPVAVCYFQVAAPPEIQNAATTRAQTVNVPSVFSIAMLSLEMSLVAIGIGVMVGIVVWSDAKKLGDPNPAIWAVGTALLLIIVLPIYLIYRSKGKIGKQQPD